MSFAADGTNVCNVDLDFGDCLTHRRIHRLARWKFDKGSNEPHRVTVTVKASCKIRMLDGAFSYGVDESFYGVGVSRLLKRYI